MVKAAYRHERAAYGLRSTRKPMQGQPLAGTVAVADDQGKGFSYIAFTEAFVAAVGRTLPRGISTDDPGYIKVVHHGRLGVWKVYAYYLGGSKGVLLWETKVKPVWLKRIGRPDCGENT